MTFRASLLVLLSLAACGPGRSGSTGATPGTDGAPLWEPYSCTNLPEGHPEQCLVLAREYAAEMRNADACVPEDACGPLRPAVVSLVTGQSTTLEGLCNCPVLVNASRSAALDAVLARFLAAGCHVGCCPCPPAAPAPHPCIDSGPLAGSCG
jgi:hypothetical protein